MRTTIGPLEGLFVHNDGVEVMEGPNAFNLSGTGFTVQEILSRKLRATLDAEMEINNQWAVLPTMHVANDTISSALSANQVQVIECLLPTLTFDKLSMYVSATHANTNIAAAIYDIDGALIAETGWFDCLSTGLKERTLDTPITKTQQTVFLAFSQSRSGANNASAMTYVINSDQAAFFGTRMGTAANVSTFGGVGTYGMPATLGVISAATPEILALFLQ